jgi:hypothetical protein
MPNVNNSPRQNKTVEQILRDNGIALKTLTIGRHYTLCPQCSAKRKVINQKKECLGVTIEADGVHWGCNHCPWTGGGPTAPEPVKTSSPVHYNYTPYLRKVRLGKKHKPPFVWEHRVGDEWLKGSGGQDTRDLLYKYHLVQAAMNAGEFIALVEGEKDADTLWNIGIPATTSAHGAGKWTKGNSDALLNANIILLWDNDAVGIDHAERVYKAVKPLAKSIRKIDLKQFWPDIKDGQDVSDFIAAGHDFAAVWEATKKVSNGHTTLTDEEIETIIRMGPMEMAAKVKQIARDKGVDQLSVRKEVKDRATSLGIQPDRLQGRRLEFEEPVPWADPVDGAALLAEISEQAGRFLVLPEHAADILAIWAVYTYIPNSFGIAPRLQITAPEKRCGKTTTLDFLHELSYRRIQCGNITPAAFFRVVEMYHPALLIDEVDTFALQHPEIKNVLNHGHAVNGAVLRCAGDDSEPRYFSCFAPVAYAHIGSLDPTWSTLKDRSIAIHMARRAPDEKIERLSIIQKNDGFRDIRRKIKRFVTDNGEAIVKAVPDLSMDNDRLADNWRPLLSIATVAGEEWTDRIKAAIVEPEDAMSFGEMLLEDCMSFRDKIVGDEIMTNGLVERLNDMEDRPWAEMGSPPRPLTAKRLAKMMKEYGIKPYYDAHRSTRYYNWNDIEAAWKRYARAIDPPKQSTDLPQTPVSDCNGGGRLTETQSTPDLPHLPHLPQTDDPELDDTADDWQFNQ